MKTAHLFSAIILIGLSSIAEGQGKIPKDTVANAVQTATTRDGREVVLMADGTWRYLDGRRTSQAGPPPETAIKPTIGTGILALQAGVLLQSADVKPVARTDFLLLDQSLTAILRKAGVEAPAQFVIESQSADERLLSAYGSSFKYSFPEYVAFRARATAAIRPHLRSVVTSDFTGKATFQAVPPGTYYLVGYATVGRSSVLWNLRVQIGNGRSSVTLDNRNAALVQSIAP